jgi:hypothetical protein
MKIYKDPETAYKDFQAGLLDHSKITKKGSWYLFETLDCKHSLRGSKSQSKKSIIKKDF